MKKLIISSIILLVAITAIIFYSCKKEDTSNSILIEKSIIQCSNVDISFIENPYSIEDYLSNNKDYDAENIDRKLYTIGLKARNLFTNTNLNTCIINSAITKANDCIDLRSFEWSSIITDDCFQDDIRELIATIESTNLQYSSKNSEIFGQVENYIPAIFVINIENADPLKMPFFSPGVPVDEDLPGMDKYEDHIVIWYFDSEIDDFVEGIISEEMALTTTHPIFIIDNACEIVTQTLKTSNNVVVGSSTCTAPPPTNQMKKSYYSSYEYQINHRYENSGNSEFCVTSVAIDENGGGGYWLNSPNFWYKIAEVKKNDIGKLLSKWSTFCRPNSTGFPDVTPFDCNYVFWNSFERDWFRSNKNLGTPTANGKKVYMYGNMQYNSDWYAYKPADVQSNPLALSFIFNNWAKWHENSKGKLRIWRVDP